MSDQPDARLAALEAENARLRDQLAATKPPRRQGIGRGILAAACVTLAVVIAPVAVVASWAANELSSTDHFVDSLRGLSDDQRVLDFVSSTAASSIDSAIDIDGMTRDTFDGIAGLGLPPRAAAALQNLAPAAADGIRGALTSVVTRVVDSDEFDTVWVQTLRFSHGQMVAILTDDRSGVVVADAQGVMGLRLAPVIERLKQRLEEAQFPLASAIPVIDRTVPLATVEAIAPARTGYQALLTGSTVLPIAGVLLLGAGILIARNRARAMLVAGIALTLTLTVFLVLLGVARAFAVGVASGSAVPSAVTTAVFDALTTTMRGAGLAVALIGLSLAAAGFLLGRSPQATAIRLAAAGAQRSAHGMLERNRLVNERVASALASAWPIIVGLVLVVAVVVLGALRPLTPLIVLSTALVCLVVLALVRLFAAPAAEPEEAVT